jgi:hypothetical protein
VHLEELKSLLDKISKIERFTLAVVNLVSHVEVLHLEEVHDWQDLSVVWHKSLTNGVRAGHESLQNLKSDSNNLWVSGVESSLDWDNQLWDDWQYLGTSLVEHIEDTLDSKESVWINLFSNSLKEDWKVVMII